MRGSSPPMHGVNGISRRCARYLDKGKSFTCRQGPWQVNAIEEGAYHNNDSRANHPNIDSANW